MSYRSDDDINIRRNEIEGRVMPQGGIPVSDHVGSSIKRIMEVFETLSPDDMPRVLNDVLKYLNATVNEECDASAKRFEHAKNLRVQLDRVIAGFNMNMNAVTNKPSPL